MTIIQEWLAPRELRLPKWAQERICGLRAEVINLEMGGEVCGILRSVANETTGGNCTFADDDAHLLAGLAALAIDADLHLGHITDRRTLADMQKAKEARAEKRAASGSGAAEGESPTAEGGDAQ